MTDLDRKASEYATNKYSGHGAVAGKRHDAALDFLAGAAARQPEVDALVAGVRELETIIRCERESNTCVMVHDPDRKPCGKTNCRYFMELEQVKS